MKLFALALLTILAGSTTAFGAPSAPPVAFELEGVTVSDVVSLVYRDLLRVPFALSPEVYADRRPLSVRFEANAKAARSQFRAYLTALGYRVRSVGGLDYVEPLPPPVAPVPDPVETAVFVYKPKHREAAYLSAVLRPAFSAVNVSGSGASSMSTSVPAELGSQPPSSAGALLDQRADAVVFNGPAPDIERLKALLVDLDTPQGELDIRATVYEVTTGKRDTSAFQLAAELLNKVSPSLQVGINAGSTQADSFIRFKTGSMDSVLSALSTDERFNIVTSPTVRARSGSETQFQAGSQVPVLGQVTYAGNNGSVPVQSVVYRDSGVIFRVRPTVREGTVDLDVHQELSNFTATTTGVNNSPTLIRRALTSSLSLQPGEVVILGGLTEDKKTITERGLGFLPFLSDRVEAVNRTEILLVLQVDRVGQPAPPTGREPEDGAGWPTADREVKP